MTSTGLPRFLLLYSALFSAFGVASPFFAAFLSERGLNPQAIGLVLAAGTAARLLARLQVRDLAIQEPDVEDVIRSLFSGQLQDGATGTDDVSDPAALEQPAAERVP